MEEGSYGALNLEHQTMAEQSRGHGPGDSFQVEQVTWTFLSAQEMTVSEEQKAPGSLS